MRSYSFAQSLAPVIGYTGLADSVELDERFDLLITDVTGKTGIEKQYDAVLRGSHGAAYREVDAAQRPQKDLGEKPAVAGADLVLAIDVELQEYIYQLLEERELLREDVTASWPEGVNREQPVVGAVVALDPATGALRALVSYPSFDPN